MIILPRNVPCPEIIIYIHTYIAFFITYKRYTDFYLMNRNCLAKLLGDSYPFDDEMKENLIHQVIQSDFFGMVKT